MRSGSDDRIKWIRIMTVLSGSTSRARKSPDASGAGTKPRLDDSAPAEQPLIRSQDTPLQVDGRPGQPTEGVKVDALILQNPRNSFGQQLNSREPLQRACYRVTFDSVYRRRNRQTRNDRSRSRSTTLEFLKALGRSDREGQSLLRLT
jgi:hypothetical protein